MVYDGPLLQEEDTAQFPLGCLLLFFTLYCSRRKVPVNGHRLRGIAVGRKAFATYSPSWTYAVFARLRIVPLAVKNKLLVRATCLPLPEYWRRLLQRPPQVRVTTLNPAAAKDTPQARNDTCALEVSVQGKLDGSIFEPRGIPAGNHGELPAGFHCCLTWQNLTSEQRAGTLLRT